MMERKMFYGAKAGIFKNAKELRENMTEAESFLWNKLNKNQLKGYRFKPQHPVDMFIVDFYCHKAMIVIELNGEIHNFQKEYDQARTEELESMGLKVIRFTNKEVLKNIDNVIEEIEKYLPG